jgi:hypothetical protein
MNMSSVKFSISNFDQVLLQHAIFNRAERHIDPTITIEYVTKCPENTTAWQKAEERKNCSAYEYARDDNRALRYHCVMNTYRNATLEICYPKVHIIGEMCFVFT